MSNDFFTNPIATTNYELVHDVETYKCVANVGSCVKFEQTCSKHKLFHFFILKFIQVDLYNLYVDPKKHFSHD
jgi:hypothetical protein